MCHTLALWRWGSRDTVLYKCVCFTYFTLSFISGWVRFPTDSSSSGKFLWHSLPGTPPRLAKHWRMQKVLKPATSRKKHLLVSSFQISPSGYWGMGSWTVMAVPIVLANICHIRWNSLSHARAIHRREHWLWMQWSVNSVSDLRGYYGFRAHAEYSNPSPF